MATAAPTPSPDSSSRSVRQSSILSQSVAVESPPAVLDAPNVLDEKPAQVVVENEEVPPALLEKIKAESVHEKIHASTEMVRSR